MASTPEQSDYTSLKLRIEAALTGKQPQQLLPFIGNERKFQPKGIVFELKAYLELVDETGRLISDNKRGAISLNTEKLLDRLNIPTENWLKIISEFGILFHGPVGTLQELSCYCEHLEKRRRHFTKCCQYMGLN